MRFSLRIISIFFLMGVLCSCVAYEGSESAYIAPSVSPIDKEAISTGTPIPAAPTPTPTPTGEPAAEPLKYTEYNISVIVDPETRTVTGVEKISCRNRTGGVIDKLYLNVYNNAYREDTALVPYFPGDVSLVFTNSGRNYGYMNITGVTVSGIDAEYALEGTVLSVTLGKDVKADEQMELSIRFEALVPVQNHRTGSNGSAMWFGNFFPTVAAYDKNGWNTEPYYPVGDPFFSNISNYNIKVITPLNYSVVGTGTETYTETATERTTDMSARMVRDFAFAVSTEYRLDTRITESGKTINIYTYSEIDTKRFLDAAEKSLNYYSGVISGYPYDTFTIIETALGIKNEMAYPKVGFIDTGFMKSEPESDALLQVVSTGIAHQWFYNVTGSNRIKEAWLDDGLSSYVSYLMMYTPSELKELMEAEYSALPKVLKAMKDLNLSSDLSEFQSAGAYSAVHIRRARLMLYSFHTLVGDDSFYEFLKTYQMGYSFKVSSAEAFVNTACESTGIGLVDFFNYWMNNDEMPQLYWTMKTQ